MWGSLTLWNQHHKWYVSVGSPIGLLATVFLCCQTAMLNKHLLWDRVINADRLASTSLSSLLNHTPARRAPSLRGAPPLYLKWTLRDRCSECFQGVSGWWVIIGTPQILWISTEELQAKSFFWHFFLVFSNKTVLSVFRPPELFLPLINILKTTCFSRLSPVTWVLFFNFQAIMLCNTKQIFKKSKHSFRHAWEANISDA